MKTILFMRNCMSSIGAFKRSADQRGRLNDKETSREKSRMSWFQWDVGKATISLLWLGIGNEWFLQCTLLHLVRASIEPVYATEFKGAGFANVANVVMLRATYTLGLILTFSDRRFGWVFEAYYSAVWAVSTCKGSSSSSQLRLVLDADVFIPKCLSMKKTNFRFRFERKPPFYRLLKQKR